MELFSLNPKTSNEFEVKRLYIGIFNLEMKIDEFQRQENINQLYLKLKSNFDIFLQNYPWIKPTITLKKFQNVKNWCGIYISGPFGYSIEDLNLIKSILFKTCSKDQNIFITIKINDDDQLLPDFNEFDLNVSGNGESDKPDEINQLESTYKLLNWNRFWWNGNYIYKIPLNFMENQKLNLSLSLEYLLKRNLNKLSRFRIPNEFIDSIKHTLSSFHKVNVKITGKLAHLIDLNPWLPRCALIEDYFYQEINPTTPIVFPGSSLRKFENLSQDYRIPIDDEDDDELIKFTVLLNTLGASLLENAPFENISLELKGLLLTNVIELFLQWNNKLPIDAKTNVHYPSSNAVVQDEVSKWDTLLEMMNLNIVPEPLVKIHRLTNMELIDEDEENIDQVYTKEDIDLNVFKRPINEELMEPYFSKFDRVNILEEQIDIEQILNPPNPNNDISEDDFFEFFLKNALKMADEEVEALRNGIDNL